MLVKEVYSQENNVVLDSNLACEEVPSGAYGIEIEVEQHNFRTALDHWRVVSDGSLRDGAEYVFREPYQGKDVLAAVNDVCATLSERSHIFSDRCSTHVHVDVSDFNMETLSRLLVLYTIVEPCLLRYSGRAREDNVYCMPVRKTAGFGTYMADFIERQNPDYLHCMTTEELRYGALNLASLRKFNTVEFRSLEGTGDRDRLLDWVYMCGSIRNYALNSTLQPATLIKVATKLGVKEFCAKVFNKELVDKYELCFTDSLFKQGLYSASFLFTAIKKKAYKKVKRGESLYSKIYGDAKESKVNLDMPIQLLRGTPEWWSMNIRSTMRLGTVEPLERVLRMHRTLGRRSVRERGVDMSIYNLVKLEFHETVRIAINQENH